MSPRKRSKKEKPARTPRQKNSRVTAASAGCVDCGKRWDGANAVSCAARHHDASGHRTWAEQVLYTEYGGDLPKAEQEGQPASVGEVIVPAA